MPCRLNPNCSYSKRIFMKLTLISLLSFLFTNGITQFSLSQLIGQPITISDNFNIIRVGGIEVKANDIIIEENHAFIIEQKSVLVFNIEDKSTPILIANYTNEEMNLRSIKKSGSYIFTWGNNLSVFQYMNDELVFISEAALRIGPYNSTMELCTLDINGDVALITSTYGFVLVDISDVTSLNFISEVYLGAYLDKYVSGGTFYDKYVLITYFEIYGRPSRILIYNTSNAFQPEYITSFQGTHVSLRDEFAYVLTLDFLFQYDLSNITSIWVNNFIRGLYGEKIDIELYQEYAIVLFLDHKWTISFYNVDCYPFQLVYDIEVDKQYNKLYIRDDFGYFVGKDFGIDIFQFSYENKTPLFSFYSLFLILFIIFPILSLSKKIKKLVRETRLERADSYETATSTQRL